MLKLRFHKIVSWVLPLIIFVGCIKEDVNSDNGNNQDEFKTSLPVIMIHGALASGDTYARPAMLLTSNNYPESLIFAFDWNSLGGANAEAQTNLDAFVDKILAQTGKEKCILIGHSAGGGLGYAYCADIKRAPKVSKYIHIGSNPQSKPAGPNGEIPTLNIYSKGDKIVQGADIPGATNTVFETLDHYQVATSTESFEAIYRFIKDGKTPGTKIIKPESQIRLKGRVVTLGENKPDTKVQVEVYYVNPVTGERKGNAVHTFSPDNEGNFGPVSVQSNEYVEFEITSAEPGFRTLHYYREPFTRSNSLVYLRTFPPASSLAGILLSSLPKSDQQSVVAVFTANQAVIHQRDQLMVQNKELSNSTLCSPANSTIAMFLYDNGDKSSSGNPHATFSFIPFLKGADIYFPTEQPAPIDITFNGRKMNVKNYKSESEGVIIAVFD
jgi:triacylglycerol esterase/lipase EstA (alpha/beta hydrolase family)